MMDMTHPPITDEMVERAVRAIRGLRTGASSALVWCEIGEAARDVYRAEARAALDAALSAHETKEE